MSGYKRATVVISQDEYDRLKESEQKLRLIPDVREEALQTIRQQSQEAFQSNLTTIHQRQSDFETMLSGLDDQVQDLETATTRAILGCETRTSENVQNYAGSLWDHFDQALQEHARYFELTIAANHQLQQEGLNLLSRNVRRITENQEQKHQMAETWLNAADQFCQFIQANYAYQVFTPGQVEKLERQLNQAWQNLEIGLSEAVILNAQQLYTAFSDLRIELERLQNEWQMLLQAAWEAACQLLDQADVCEIVPAVDLDGNSLPFEIDVDYWSVGRLTLFKQEMSYVRDRLESDMDLPDSETLGHWLSIDLPQYSHALADILLDARINALNSQLRINIADLVVRALQEQGFALEGSDYAARDGRNTYEVQLTNLEGSQVQVQVAPTGQALGANELHLHSSDGEERTEHELQQRWYEVSRSLSRYGLEVGPFIRENAEPYHTNPAVNPRRHPVAERRRGSQKASRPGSSYGD